MPLLPATFTSSIAQSRTNATVSASTTTRDAHTIIEMEGSSQTIAEILTEHVNTPNGHIAQLPMNDVMQGLTSLANELDNVLTEETANAPASTQELVVTIESLMRGDSDAVNPSYEYITLNIDDPSLFENSRHSQETSLFVQRAQAIVDSLGELRRMPVPDEIADGFDARLNSSSDFFDKLLELIDLIKNGYRQHLHAATAHLQCIAVRYQPLPTDGQPTARRTRRRGEIYD